MTDMLATVRSLLATRTSASPYSDDDLDAFLRAHRTQVWRARLMPLIPLTGNPTTFASNLDYWEDLAGAEDEGAGGVRFYSGSSDITPTVDTWSPQDGLVTFSDLQAGVVITGGRYDLWSAVGDCLTAWASRVMLEFSFTGGSGQQYNRNEQHAMLLSQAQAAYARAQGGTGHLYQSDAVPDYFGYGSGWLRAGYGWG